MRSAPFESSAAQAIRDAMRAEERIAQDAAEARRHEDRVDADLLRYHGADGDTVHYDVYDSPVGPLLLATDRDGLRVLGLPRRNGKPMAPAPNWSRRAAALRDVARQLDGYFAGTRHRFELELNLKGTPFQLAVWNLLLEVPFGDTQSYGALARKMGSVSASRAVGAANGANPIAIVVPCHRIIGTNGSLTGYGGGLPTKEFLLTHERRHAPTPAFSLA